MKTINNMTPDELSNKILKQYRERINFYLSLSDLTQHQIEAKAGLSKNDLVQMKVQQSVNFRKALQLANFFKISVFQLLPINIEGELKNTDEISKEIKTVVKNEFEQGCKTLIKKLF